MVSKNTNAELWRDAILDQLVDAQCAIRDGSPAFDDYARECMVNALAMFDDAKRDKPASLILKVHLPHKNPTPTDRAAAQGGQ
jgi:hypothetical protein